MASGPLQHFQHAVELLQDHSNSVDLDGEGEFVYPVAVLPPPGLELGGGDRADIVEVVEGVVRGEVVLVPRPVAARLRRHGVRCLHLHRQRIRRVIATVLNGLTARGAVVCGVR